MSEAEGLKFFHRQFHRMVEQVSLNQITKNAKIDFHNLLKKSLSLSQKYEKQYGLDARRDFFMVYFSLNLWLLIQLDIFLELLNPQTTRFSQYVSLTPKDRVQFLLQYDTINRASYYTKAMFEVEYFLKAIGGNLGLNADEKYYNLINNLSSCIGLSEHELKILNAPAQLRNSLHNNGYANRDFEVTLRDKQYKFVKGQQVKFSGWDNTYIIFDELLDVLVEIIDNPRVQQIPFLLSWG